MKGRKKKQQEEKPGILKGIRAQLPVFILGIVSTLVALFITLWSEPNLKHMGGPMLTPVLVNSRVINGMLETHLIHKISLKNVGFRRGHVDKIVIEPEGLYEAPVGIKVLHIDKSDIGWREEKDIAYEVIVQSNEFKEKEKTLAFKVYYYGPSGNEIHNEGMVTMITRSDNISDAPIPWTTDIPTQPGTYWHKKTPIDTSDTVNVHAIEGKLMVTVNSATPDVPIANLKGYWRGPIPPSSGPGSR
jgi:hypothetical protein